MTPSLHPIPGGEHKLYDPADPATPAHGSELLDPSAVLRNGQWTLFSAGQAHCFGPPNLFSATLPPGAPLSPSGWTVARDPSGELLPVASGDRSAPWDAGGGRHCPSYVCGVDPATNRPIERIYYAGAADHIGGPYSIGYLEWDGERWLDQPEPAFLAAEPWEHDSVYEPNLLFHDGLWKLWYVAGANRDDYLVHGYAESPDGRSNWKRTIFAPPEMKMFDFCVRPHRDAFAAVFTRVSVRGQAPPEAGLWWCTAPAPSGRLADWGQPLQIMSATDRGWHTGPFKPSLAFDPSAPDKARVFFAGSYNTGEPGPFPFAFTTGSLELTFLEPLPRRASCRVCDSTSPHLPCLPTIFIDSCPHRP